MAAKPKKRKPSSRAKGKGPGGAKGSHSPKGSKASQGTKGQQGSRANKAPQPARASQDSNAERGAKTGPTTSKRDRRAAAQRQAEVKRKGSWAVLFLGAAVIVGIIGFSIKSSIDNSNAGVAEATSWELPALYGGEDVTLASFSGKPVVVNFFASWCTACEAELPEFHDAVEEFGDRVQFVFVDSQDSDGLGKEMAERHGIDAFTVAKDFGASNASFFRELGGRGMPITAFYNTDGSLRFVSSGAMLNGAIEDALTQFGFI